MWTAGILKFCWWAEGGSAAVPESDLPLLGQINHNPHYHPAGPAPSPNSTAGSTQPNNPCCWSAGGKKSTSFPAKHLCLLWGRAEQGTGKHRDQCREAERCLQQSSVSVSASATHSGAFSILSVTPSLAVSGLWSELPLSYSWWKVNPPLNYPLSSYAALFTFIAFNVLTEIVYIYTCLLSFSSSREKKKKATPNRLSLTCSMLWFGKLEQCLAHHSIIGAQ